ncbi:hypothetical protein GR160_08375 [Flavobacterium sp. Sd200]|uniref:hypothetical protein n=1 Tax=Flavobacterium sp. Sd200 TaxID=2692211 RepID=UPI00136B3310|nr:hypothetical protein [Flavobacterium sp. Sd200]MXN91243.1 hypothetical protein [Flavobacterium sp. Sd200]
MKHLLYILLFISLPLVGQVRQPLQGKIVSGESVVAGVFVINKATGAEVKTDNAGLFCLDARVGDRLAVYSPNIAAREFAVNDFSFKEAPYTMEVTLNGYELKEVVINEVTSEKLGIVPKGQKQYTPAERRLKTASDFSPTIGVGTMAGVSVSADAIINAITGRTKMLKKALATERKEFDMQRIDNIYTEEQIISDLKVPAEYVNGFLFYAVEDVEFSKALKAKNNELAKLKLMVLAERYNKLIAGQ